MSVGWWQFQIGSLGFEVYPAYLQSINQYLFFKATPQDCLIKEGLTEPLDTYQTVREYWKQWVSTGTNQTSVEAS